MQRNMLPTATTLHFISYLCSIRHAIYRLFIYYMMEKEIKTQSLAHRNFMRINLLGSLLIVAFDVALTVYGWGCDRIRWGYLVIYALPILFPWRRNRLEIIHREALAQHGWPPTFRRQRTRFGLLSDRHRLQRQHVMHHFHTHLLRSRRPILCARPVTLLLCFQEIV